MSMNVEKEHLSSEQVRKLRKLSSEGDHTEHIVYLLRQDVYGQDEATMAVAKRLALIDAGLYDGGKPLGAFLLLGPTGVGKTELAHAVSRFWFGDRQSDRLMIIDCATLSEDHQVLNLTGAPPSYVGNDEPPLIPHNWLHQMDEDGPARSIIVFDELEKANPTIYDALLSMLDAGRLVAREGKDGRAPLNFENTLLLFTSNIGGRQIQEIQDAKKVGFVPSGQDRGSKAARMEKASQAQLKRFFSPEFLGRIGEANTLVFKPLSPEALSKIFEKLLRQKNEELTRRHTNIARLDVTKEFKDAVLAGVTGRSGGREVRDGLNRWLLEPAVNVLKLVEGGSIIADIEDGSVVFYTDHAAAGKGSRKREGEENYEDERLITKAATRKFIRRTREDRSDIE